MLTSAGIGAIPLSVFRNKAKYYEAAELFKALPDRCDYTLLARGAYDFSSWIKVSCQGLFGYDWNTAAGQYVPNQPYQLISVPKQPLTLPEIPSAIQQWIRPILFDVEFGVAKDLIVELQFTEVNL